MAARGYFYISEPGSEDDSGIMESKRRRFVPLTILLGLVLFIVMRMIYGVRICTVLPVGDSGELATAAYTGGIAHPPGYPLFVLLGRFFSHLRFHAPQNAFPEGMFDPAFRMNMLALWLGVLTVLVVYILLARALRNPFAAFLGAFVFGTGFTFLSQSLVGEVYTLNALITALIIYVIFLIDKKPTPGLLILLALLYGLGFASHSSILLILIPILIFIWLTTIARGLRIRKSLMIAMLVLFFIGLLPYLYLPIASHGNPFLDWGNPETPGNFLKAVTRSEFRNILESIPPTEESLGTSGIARAFRHWQRESFGLWFVIFGYVGMLIALGRGRRFSLFLALCYLFMTVPYFIYFRNITSLDLFYLEVYYIPAHIVFAIFLGYFFLAGIEYFPRILKRRNMRALLALLVFILFSVMTFGVYRTGGGSFSMRNHTVGSRFAYDILRDIPQNSILITDQDEIFLFWYLQQVAEFRRDVVVLELNALTMTHSWWWDSIRRMYPELGVPAGGEGSGELSTDLFIPALHSLNPNNPIYFTAIPPDFNPQSIGCRLVPDGLVFAFGEASEFQTPLRLDTPLVRGLFDSPLDFDITRIDAYENALVERYAFAYYNYGNYFLASGQETQGNECLIRSFDLKPDFQPKGFLPAAGILARAKMKAGDWAGAGEILKKLIDYGHADSVWYFLYAQALIRQNMLDDARKTLLEALKKDPKNQFLQSLLAKISGPINDVSSIDTDIPPD